MHIIRHRNLVEAIDARRNLVKLSDPNLWKQAAPEGIQDWQPGSEIRSEALGISLFRTGTQEKPHYHERVWELYQVLTGRLRIAVKRFRKDAWQLVTLEQHDLLLLAPGTVHLVDSTCEHTSQVIQVPPALSDQVLIEDQDDVAMAEGVLCRR